MYSVKTGELKPIITECRNAEVPLFVQGTFGIGKSDIVKQSAMESADEAKKKFVEWHDLTSDERGEIIDNPEPYFVLVDQRLSMFDPTELRGIPNLASADRLELIPYSWVVYVTQPKASGYVFFDEINLAAPSITASAYQFIHNRVVADRRIADGIWTCAAGNLSTDRANVMALPLPLRDRFAEIELEVDSTAWANDWAYKNAINPHLITFIKWMPDMLHKINDKNTDKSSTPRGVARTSKLIGEREVTDNFVHQLVSISVGNAFATQFQNYCKHIRELDWVKIFADPSPIADWKADRLWAVAGGLSNMYIKGKKDPKEFIKYLEVITHMRKDFGITTLRLMKDPDVTAFIKMLEKVRTTPIYQKIAKEYASLLAG